MARFFNTNLKFIRQQKGISQQELADKAGVDRSTVSRWENEEMDATVEKAIQIAEILGVPFPEFLGTDLRFDNVEVIALTKNTVKIPVLGVIKAGTPIEAQQDIIDYVEIPADWISGGKQYFALKISGNSMSPKYEPGDKVVFEQTNDFESANNKECCIMVNGFDATFKKFNIRDNGVTLTPLNLENDDGYLPTTYTKEQVETLPVRILGIAKRRITDY